MDRLNKPVADIADETLREIVREVKQKSVWKNTNKYIEIKRLPIDKRGSFGERFFAMCLQQIYHRRIKFEYADGDQGDWDLKVNERKFEIKTASLDVNHRFQNEGLKKDGDYAAIFFLGVSPDDLYIKFWAKKNIDWEKLHDRGTAKTGRGFKCDFKLNEMEKITSLADVKKAFDQLTKDLKR